MENDQVTRYDEWIENPAQAYADLSKTVDGMWEGGGFLGFCLLAGAVGLKLSKYIPGWGPLVHGVGSSILSTFKPNKVKQAEEKAKVMEKVAWEITKQIESLPPGSKVVKDLKKKIKNNTPAEFEQIFFEWKKEQEKKEKEG